MFHRIVDIRSAVVVAVVVFVLIARSSTLGDLALPSPLRYCYYSYSYSYACLL